MDESSALYTEIHQLVNCNSHLEKGTIDYVQQLVQLLQRFFIVDLERAMELKMDDLFWTTIKQLIDHIREEKGSGMHNNLDNVVNLCVSWMCDLSLKACSKYQLPCHDIPSFVSLSPGLRGDCAELVSPSAGNAFIAFLCLRLGDLFRYKGNYDLCVRLYRCSLRGNPSYGDPWNQLGLIASLKAKPLDSLYFNVRAFHCPIPFTPASTNISNLFRKYAQKEFSTNDCFSDQYLTILARCHFLLPVPDHAIAHVGPQLTNRKLLVAPLSLLQPLGNAQDEIRARHSLIQLLTLAFNKATELLLCKKPIRLRPDLLLCIVLLLRVPDVCRCDPLLVSVLSESQQDVIFDNEKLETFRCFSESDPFEYPVSYGQIAGHLSELVGEKADDRKASTQGNSRCRRRRTVLCAPQHQFPSTNTEPDL
ncbi:hypothetical protein RB195_000338 [Necator americanus]|uniref:DNA/RNA-binding domain-containing protein n=1 Tax=Necator americanus TaxID=51031 RepID=A0ABR1D953_NECAM